MIRALSIIGVAAATLIAGAAQAKKPRKHEFGIGAMGVVNGSFIGEPSAKEIEEHRNDHWPYRS